jgi:2-keto-4-pentenoate hydratase/2-oxohepta-3-ene-1,7-dioic acid hydratase in catechol pathway
VDYEAELVVVVGVGGRHIAEDHALEHVVGYSCGHDVSARDWQLGKPGKQWLLGKTFDTFAPFGPYLVTTDEVGDPGNLHIQLRLNGQIMQDSSTRQLIFSIPKLVAYISNVCTLEPGDIIFTGTPPGVGMARTPPVFLQSGDVIEVEIERLGVLRNAIQSEL